MNINKLTTIKNDIVNSCVFTDDLFRTYFFLYSQANTKPGNFDNRIIEVGQLVTGRLSLAKKLNCSPGVAAARLKKLQNSSVIKIESLKHYSIITLCNYNELQGKSANNTSENDNFLTGNDKKTEKTGLNNCKNNTTLVTTTLVTSNTSKNETQIIEKSGVNETDNNTTDSNTTDSNTIIYNNIYKYISVQFPNLNNERFKKSFSEWVTYQGGNIPEITIKKQLEFLNAQTNPTECINQSIRNNYKGLFPVKSESDTQNISYTSEELKEMILKKYSSDRDLINAYWKSKKANNSDQPTTFKNLAIGIQYEFKLDYSSIEKIKKIITEMFIEISNKRNQTQLTNLKT